MNLNDYIKYAKYLDNHKKYKKADIFDKIITRYACTGEYWIVDGQAEYADLETGDVGHEMLAQHAILNEIGFDAEDFQRYPDHIITTEYAEDIFRDYCRNNGRYADEDSSDPIDQYLYQLKLENGDDTDFVSEADLVDYLIFKTHANKQKFLEKWQYLHHGKARDYAMKEYGWIRVDCASFGAYVQMQNLDHKNISNLIHGLDEIFGEDADNKVFNIEIKEPYKFYQKVSMNDIVSGDILKKNKDIDNDNDYQDYKRIQLPTPGGYQYKEVGAAKL